jgi:predicted transcriptional regulator
MRARTIQNVQFAGDLLRAVELLLCVEDADPAQGRTREVTKLGQLERAVMDALWDTAGRSSDTASTARDIAATLPRHAYTTVLTVLDRLTRKGLVERIRDGRTHHYLPTGSRESYTAELMHEALAATSDRKAALVHFAETVSPDQAEVLRGVLERLDPSRTEGPTP